MQVILLERVAKLGQMGDVVDVKPGYARNFLLPQGKAKSASESNIAAFETEKAKLEAHNLETKKEADALATNLNGQKFTIIRSASDTGALYGSVTPRDAADAANEAGFTIDRKQFTLKSPGSALAASSPFLLATSPCSSGSSPRARLPGRRRCGPGKFPSFHHSHHSAAVAGDGTLATRTMNEE